MSGVPSTPRVLHVLGDFDDQMGGLQTAVMVMANAQVAAGVEVAIAAGRRAGATYANTASLDPRVTRRLMDHSAATGRFGGSRGLGRWLWAHARDFDAVHVHSMWNLPAVLAAGVALLRGTRLIISPHGSLEQYDLRKHHRAKRVLGPVFVRPLLARAAVVLCTTSREAAGMETYGARPRTRVIPIPPGEMPPARSTRAEFRARYGISDSTALVLFLGRVDEKKGITILIDALGRLPADIDATLLVVGAGDERLEQRLRAQAQRDGLGDRVVWAGWLSGQDKADAFHAADLFVLLSFNENYGITVVEAAQAGLPVLLTHDVYSSAELLEAGAAQATSRDPGVAADAMAALLGDPAALDALRLGAARFAEGLDPGSVQLQYRSIVTG